MSMHNIAHIH